MQLSDRDIFNALDQAEIGFVGTNEKYPFLYDKQVQPSSIDLRLGDIIARFKKTITSIDIKNDVITPDNYLDVKQYADAQPIVIDPGEIVYGQIYEQMWICDKYSARVEGRSRMARLGLSVHCTGGYINPGFCGAMPLQLINHNTFSVTIYPYTSVCQMVLFEISDEPLVKYSDRSRIYNPYFEEQMASPSVLRSPNAEQLSNQDIAEYRMSQLVKNFYNNGLNRNRITAKSEKQVDEELIRKIVINNIQLGESVRMRDNYTGTQVGTQGPGSGTNASIVQNFNSSKIDFSKLKIELEELRKHLKDAKSDEEDADIMRGDVAKAAKALKADDKNEALQILKSAGNTLLEIAQSIGCSIIANIITGQIGI